MSAPAQHNKVVIPLPTAQAKATRAEEAPEATPPEAGAPENTKPHPTRLMRQYELVERVEAYNPHTNEDLLHRAYVYAMVKHGEQKRADGDPYFAHPLEVAAILTDLKLDDATIVAALLHDTVEDTDATHEEIREKFGPEISRLVEGLTKIKQLDLVSKKAAQAENLRKLLLAMAEDVRVLLVKLADRLHNMRTLGVMREEKRARISAETMDIYAPLAGRMGMQSMREELEDLAFRWLHPQAYATVTERLDEQREDYAQAIAEIETELKELLADASIHADVYGRAKRPYSVWRKMERKSLSLEQMSDIVGFRVIVDEISQCYQTLGVIHTRWSAVPDRFKDYISNPKENDYRSLHTTIVGPANQRVELQIRTRGMHEIAEFGVAAHPLYKDLGDDGASLRPLVEMRSYQWLRSLVSLIESSETPEDFLEHTKLELFQDQVFCFTPKGRLIALPQGATVIDFAYAVHTDVGNSAVGCKVDGRNAPLSTQLQNGEEVEILRSDRHSPPVAWEHMAITGKARAAIRRATRAAAREQFAEFGQQILEHDFARAGKSYNEAELIAALPKLARDELADVLCEVGRGEMAAKLVFEAVYPSAERPTQLPNKPADATPEEGWFGLRKAIGLRFKVPGTQAGEARPEPGGIGPRPFSTGVPIRGVRSDLPVRFAPSSTAIPGDRIVGIMHPGVGITIFPIHAAELSQFEDRPELWLDVRWQVDPDNPERFPAKIRLTALNEPGTLAQIAQIIGDQNGNISNLHMINRSADFHDMVIDVEVFDLRHLNTIISGLRTEKTVHKVERVNR